MESNSFSLPPTPCLGQPPVLPLKYTLQGSARYARFSTSSELHNSDTVRGSLRPEPTSLQTTLPGWAHPSRFPATTARKGLQVEPCPSNLLLSDTPTHLQFPLNFLSTKFPPHKPQDWSSNHLYSEEEDHRKHVQYTDQVSCALSAFPFIQAARGTLSSLRASPASVEAHCAPT